MFLANIPLNSALLSQNIAQNLGVEDVNQVNDLKVISEGYHAEAQAINTYLEESLKNFFLNTANERYLNLVGSQEGIYRIREPILRVNKEEESLFLILRDENYINDSENAYLLPKDTVLRFIDNDFILTIKEDVILSSSVAYITADLQSIENTPVTINQSTEVITNDVPDSLSSFLNGLSLGFNKDISIPIIEEDLELYRSRLIYSRNISKYGSESAIKLSVSSNPLLDFYYIDYNTYPYNIYIFNNGLYMSHEYKSVLSQYVIPQIETVINRRKSDGTVYNTYLGKSIIFSVKCYDFNNNEIVIDQNLFQTYLINSHIFGTPLEVNLNFLSTFLERTNRTERIFKMEIFKYKEGFKYLSKDSEVFINNYEYPFYVIEV